MWFSAPQGFGKWAHGDSRCWHRRAPGRAKRPQAGIWSGLDCGGSGRSSPNPRSPGVRPATFKLQAFDQPLGRGRTKVFNHNHATSSVGETDNWEL